MRSVYKAGFHGAYTLPALLVLALLLLSGCSEEERAGPTAVIWIPKQVNARPDTAPFTHQMITDELTIPWQLDFVPDGRILITERNGLVRVVRDGRLEETPWLDLRDSLRTTYGPTVGNSGLLGIALDPDFSANGYVYVGYSYGVPGEAYDYNRLVRYREDPASGLAAEGHILLDKIKGRSMHNSGPIKFGPDGKLYWSVGDRGEPEKAQDPEDEAGTILRLNRDGSIPVDNPFPGSPVYAYGLRNTQGFDWHPDSGIMVATDHGPSSEIASFCCRDEINQIEAGGNYGWPAIMGDEQSPGMSQPVLHSGSGISIEDHTWAPAGAAFIRSGPWKGSFLFAGLRSQRLWRLTGSDDQQSLELRHLLHQEYGRIRSVAQAPSGKIYILTSNLDNSPQGSDRFSNDFLIEIIPEVAEN